ncbi:MAG: phosphatase PAP2 family protein [Methylobacter sp.]
MPTQIKLKFDRFIKFHIAIPFLSFLMLFSVLELTRLDLWISQHFYNAELHQWTYKENWLAETVFHISGRYFTYICAVGMLICLLVSLRSNSSFFRYRRELVFLLLASISGPIIIALLKSATHIYCPWSLALFNGDKPYVRLFDYVTGNLEIGHCFPAAHAGSGFAFISLYFFLMVVKPKYKLYGLYFGLVLGAVYGASQQVRGAHFLSHDVFSLAVCWFSSSVLFILFFRGQFK